MLKFLDPFSALDMTEPEGGLAGRSSSLHYDESGTQLPGRCFPWRTSQRGQIYSDPRNQLASLTLTDTGTEISVKPLKINPDMYSPWD